MFFSNTTQAVTNLLIINFNENVCTTFYIRETASEAKYIMIYT